MQHSLTALELKSSRASDSGTNDVTLLIDLHKPTSVTSSCCGRFRNDAKDLAVGICDYVELYGYRDGDAILEHSFNVSARVLSLRTLPAPRKPHHFQKRDGLLTITADLQFTLSLWHLGSFVPILTVTLTSSPLGPPMPQLRTQDLPHNLQRSDAPRIAGLHTSGKAGEEVRVLAVSIFHRLLHVMVLTWPPNAPVNLIHHRLSRTGTPGLPTTQGLGLLNVQSMAFVPGASSIGSVLATLTADEGGTRNVHFMELSSDYSSFSSDYGLTLWNVHPTTSLLQAVPEGYQQGRGVVLISSVSAMLVQPESNRTEHTLRLEMEGEPVCMESISSNSWAVGDTLGGVFILSLGRDGLSASRLECSRPTCIPTTLTFLPGWGPAQAGALFVGSHGSDHQLLAAAQAPGDSVTSERGAQWELLGTAFRESFAPIQDVVRIEEPAGSGEGVLLMCCGLAPTGSVCLARMSLALLPNISDGPCLVGQPRLLAVKAADKADGEHDAYLALSFETAGYTTQLDVSGTQFREASISGLALDASTVLLDRTPSGHLLQVTPREVLVAATEHHSQPGHADEVVRWQAPGAVSMAAAEGRSLAAASGSTVYVLELPGEAEELQNGLREVAVLHHEEQISALTLLDGGFEGSDKPDLWLAVGQWVSNDVQLRRLRDGAVLGTFAIPCGQARSLAAGRLAGQLFLFVGTSEGAVIYHHIKGCDKGGKVSWGSARQVQVGLGGVDLEMVPARGAAPAHLFARAEQSLVLRLDEASRTTFPDEDPVSWIEAARVHGAEGLLSSAALHTAELPAGMAWVTVSGQLTFGSLDHRLSLRAHRISLQETPSAVVYHAESGCALVLSEDIDGSSWLRLFRATSLRQVAAIKLADGHSHQAVCLAQLPCSSSARLQEQLQQTQRDRKQFVVMASNAYSCDSSGLEQAEGMLSVIEIVAQAARDGHNSRYEIVLHGTCAMDSLCFSLAAVADSRDPSTQLLVAGCQDGVHLLRMEVDDILQQGRDSVASAAQQIRAGETLPRWKPSGSKGSVSNAADGVCDMDIGAGEESHNASTRSQHASAGDLLPNTPSSKQLSTWRRAVELGGPAPGWRWRATVKLSLLCRVPAQAGGCVTCLTAFGDTVIAGELLGSLTTFRVQPQRRPPLLRQSADRQDDGRIGWVPSVVALSDTIFLGAVHPQGICMFGCDVDKEEAAEELLLNELEERGRASRLRGVELTAEPVSMQASDSQGGPATTEQPELQPLDLAGEVADPMQHVTCFCVGRLGPQSGPVGWASDAEAKSERVASDPLGSESGTRTPILYFTREGGVGVLQIFS